MRKVFGIVAMAVMLAACASAQTPIACVPGGAPTVVVEAFETWNGAAARIVAGNGLNGNAVIVRTVERVTAADGSITEKPWHVVVWTWYTSTVCWPAGETMPAQNPPASTPGWSSQQFLTLNDATSFYYTKAATNKTVRIVSSEWGAGTGWDSSAAEATPNRMRAASHDLRPETNTSFLAWTASVVWYDSAP